MRRKAASRGHRSNLRRMLELAHALAPTLNERTVARGIGSVMLGEEPDAPSAGNLFEPRPGWAGVSGGIDDEVGRRAKAGAWRLTGAALGSGLLVWSLLRKARSRGADGA